MQEKQAKEDEQAAIEAAKKAAAAKAEWDRKHNQFDGLVHEDDGKKYEQDGNEVKGVNKFIKKHHHGKHHKKSHDHKREQSDIQIEGFDIADRFEYSVNEEERVFLEQRAKQMKQ